MKPIVRLLLGERASAALAAAGADAFVVIGRASYPDDPTRWAIHLLPVPMKTAGDAIAVATGQARATKVRSPKSKAEGGGLSASTAPRRAAAYLTATPST